MKTAIYPGSFNPWHIGHEDILSKALKVFDKVFVAKGINKTKFYEVPEDANIVRNRPQDLNIKNKKNVSIWQFDGLLVDFIKHLEDNGYKVDAVIRGLRSGYDLDYEMNMMYNNEDLGLKIPVVFFVTNRKYGHISSSALREIKCIKAKKS